MTLSEKRAAKKEEANKAAKMQMKVCLFSVTLLIAVVLYTAITQGVTNTQIFF